MTSSNWTRNSQCYGHTISNSLNSEPYKPRISALVRNTVDTSNYGRAHPHNFGRNSLTNYPINLSTTAEHPFSVHSSNTCNNGQKTDTSGLSVDVDVKNNVSINTYCTLSLEKSGSSIATATATATTKPKSSTKSNHTKKTANKTQRMKKQTTTASMNAVRKDYVYTTDPDQFATAVEVSDSNQETGQNSYYEEDREEFGTSSTLKTSTNCTGVLSGPHALCHHDGTQHHQPSIEINNNFPPNLTRVSSVHLSTESSCHGSSINLEDSENRSESMIDMGHISTPYTPIDEIDRDGVPSNGLSSHNSSRDKFNFNMRLKDLKSSVKSKLSTESLSRRKK